MDEKGRAPTQAKHSSDTPAQCKAVKVSGERCKARPYRDGLCFFHFDPSRAAVLGRKGGARNRHVYESKEVAPPQTAADVKALLAFAMAGILAGRIDPKLGTTLGYLGTSLLRAIETADLEQGLTALENTNEHEKQD